MGFEKNEPNRGQDALGTRGRDVRDTKQSQSKPIAGLRLENQGANHWIPHRVRNDSTGARLESDLKKQSQFGAPRVSHARNARDCRLYHLNLRCKVSQ